MASCNSPSDDADTRQPQPAKDDNDAQGSDGRPGSSGYGDDGDSVRSYSEEPIYGSTKVRRGSRIGQDRSSSYQKEATLTESDVNEISEELGREWKPLARELGYTQAMIDNLSSGDHGNNKDRAHALLIDFIRRNGCNATKERLAFALAQEKVGRRDIAEKLIGDEEFEIQQGHQLLLLKEEGRFTVSETTFTMCRDTKGELHLVRKLQGSEFEQALNAIIKDDLIVENQLRALDVNGMVQAERERKQRREEEEAKKRFEKLMEDLDKIISSLENQERRDEDIEVQKQMAECHEMVNKLQMICSELLRLTSLVGHFKEPFVFKTELVNFSMKMSSTHKDLDGLIKILQDMATRDDQLLDTKDSTKLSKLMKCCQTLGKEITMRENLCQQLLQHETIEYSEFQRTVSDTEVYRRLRQMFMGSRRRASTQPLSHNELRALTELPGEHQERRDGM